VTDDPFAEHRTIMLDEWAAWSELVAARAAVDNALAYEDVAGWARAYRAFGQAMADYTNARSRLGRRITALR